MRSVRHNLDALRDAIGDELVWRACYLAEYVDEAHALLPFDLLQARTDSAIPYPLNAGTLPESCNLYVGIDIGRKHDMTIAAVIEQTPTGFASRGFVELIRAPFNVQRETLAPLIENRNVRRVAIDATGLGSQLSEEFAKQSGYKVEPLHFTNPLKAEIAGKMLRVFQTGEISIPDHPPLIADLHSVEREITATGTIRYTAPREGGSHADRFWALGLAIHAADRRAPVTLQWMHTGPDRHEREPTLAELLTDETHWNPL